MQSSFRRPASFNRSRVRGLLGAVLLAGTMLGSMPAAAQDTNDEARLRKLEAEVRALQRKVFPEGAGFQAEITAPPKTSAAPAGPATTPMTDLLARMDAVEAQVARVTAQSEQNTNRLTQIEAKLAATSPAPVEAAPTVHAPPPPDAPEPAAQSAHKSSVHAPAQTPTGTKPSASRMQAVSAVEKPQTDDPGDDEYSYGYRLWEAKFYPEAEQQLKLYLQKYPKHSRVSFARNLLGRAYYDDGDPREAAKWFLQNYQADKKGARAPDSLLYLAKSMKQLGDTRRACIAAGEFANSYAAEAAGRLKADYDDARHGLDCTG
jgi:TolA-binding protein